MTDEQSIKAIEVPDFAVSTIQELVKKIFDDAGIYFRIFSRAKSQQSITEKLIRKNYPKQGKKMRDLIGVRVVFYFREDLDIAQVLIEKKLQCIESTIDPIKTDVFRPERMNFVCRIPKEIPFSVNEVVGDLPIDNTFEIQVRTVFSEGWHEIEHDFRYKEADVWKGMDSFSRTLNGVMASLETCEWTLSSLFSEIINQKLAEGDWKSAFKFALRIHLTDSNISDDLKVLIDTDKDFQKEFICYNRSVFIQFLTDTSLGQVPKRLENIIFIINALFVHNSQVSQAAPELLQDTINKSIMTFSQVNGHE